MKKTIYVMLFVLCICLTTYAYHGSGYKKVQEVVFFVNESGQAELHIGLLDHQGAKYYVWYKATNSFEMDILKSFQATALTALSQDRTVFAYYDGNRKLYFIYTYNY